MRRFSLPSGPPRRLRPTSAPAARPPWQEEFQYLGQDHGYYWPQRRYFDALPGEVEPLRTPGSADAGERQQALPPFLGGADVEPAVAGREPWNRSHHCLRMDHGFRWEQRRYFDEVPNEVEPLRTPVEWQSPRPGEIAAPREARRAGSPQLCSSRAPASPEVLRERRMAEMEALLAGENPDEVLEPRWIDDFQLMGSNAGLLWPKRRYFDAVPGEIRPLDTPRPAAAAAAVVAATDAAAAPSALGAAAAAAAEAPWRRTSRDGGENDDDSSDSSDLEEEEDLRRLSRRLSATRPPLRATFALQAELAGMAHVESPAAADLIDTDRREPWLARWLREPQTMLTVA